MRSLWAAAFGIAGGLLGAGLILLVSSPPRGQAVPLAPPPTPAPYLVHVAGAVLQPGVYSLPSGSRVRDAVQAAGGLAVSANAEAVNLAAPLEDGQKILVPTQVPPRPTAGPGTPNSPPEAAGGTVSYPLNLNTASPDELENLPEIGPATAAKIVAYRDAHGPFQSIEAIQEVPGIGPATFEAIRDFITVEGQ